MAEPGNRKKPQSSRSSISRALLEWYDHMGRDLPWRIRPPARGAEKPDPYKVWLSEIMLQQTTVAAVGLYYEKFLKAWPSVEELGKASEEDVLHAWAGLGYYARGRNLLKCARIIAKIFGGEFPRTEKELKTLPGIGDYTAAAIAAIAFGDKATVVDGNVERVTSRLYAIATPLPKSKARIKKEVARWVPASRPGDFAQAMMDLGAIICLARNPRCLSCPLKEVCMARAKGTAESYPRRMARKKRPTRYGTAYWIECGDHVFLRRRPSKGLLGGMPEIPTGAWLENPSNNGADAALDFVGLEWESLPGEVHHTFTHFHLILNIRRARQKKRLKNMAGQVEGYWVARDKIQDAGLPSLMNKVVKMVTG